MINLTDEMHQLINNALVNRTPCILATASPDGVPNMGFRGSMMVFDNEHLAYWERGLLSSLEHVEENPKVVVMYRDPETRVAWKFRCVASVHADDPLREQIMERVVQPELDRDPDRKGVAVLLKVEQVVTLGGELLQERVPDLRW